MATIQKPRMPPQARQATVGLLANGSSGAWEIAIDEALSGAERWWAQIEGPSVSLRFEISSVEIIDEIARFLAAHPASSKQRSNGSPKQGGSLVLGGSNLIPICLAKDDEYDDRFFFLIGPTDGLTVRFVVAGAEVSAIAEALRQVKEDLEDA